MNDTRTRVIRAAIRSVRRFGMDGVRVQNIGEMAGLSPSAMYRYFGNKEEVLTASCHYVEELAARAVARLELNQDLLDGSPEAAFQALWRPFFRFWVDRPDETVFYHRFRNSSLFAAADKQTRGGRLGMLEGVARDFRARCPGLDGPNRDLLWLHVLVNTITVAKYVVEGVLPDSPETENDVYRLLMYGPASCLVQAQAPV